MGGFNNDMFKSMMNDPNMMNNISNLYKNMDPA